MIWNNEFELNNVNMAKRTTAEFIELARKIHGDKYDYSKVEYIAYNQKVCIICQQHGEFWQTPEAHLKGKICPKCTVMTRPRLSLDEVLKRFYNAHGNKYDYSKVVYVTKDTDVEIICKKHGSFWQTPDTHWRGGNCPECNKENRKNRIYSKRCEGRVHTTDSFIEVANKLHNNFYDYSKVIYRKGRDKITIICPIHGEFQQTARKHLEGHGCKKCAIEKTKNKTAHRSKTWFINNAKLVHGNKYDYSELKYIDFNTKVELKCELHGLFTQLPRVHLLGCGCPKCGIDSRVKLQSKSTKEFIDQAKLRHGDIYDYSLVEYVNSKTPITIICKQHGPFNQTPYKHLSGEGCGKCTRKSQYRLLTRLESVFTNEQFTWEYSSNWLGRQRIDICIEKYKIAIEYDGEQHYRAVDHFGGIVGYERTVNRDLLKNKKCKENGFTLFRIRYDYTEKDFNDLCVKIKEIILNYNN